MENGINYWCIWNILYTAVAIWLTKFSNPCPTFLALLTHLPPPIFYPLPDLTVPLLQLLLPPLPFSKSVSSVSRRPTAASIVAAQALLPALSVMVASCPCWRTASMNPSVISVAKPVTPMVWRSASPAPANSAVWLTPMSGREGVSEWECVAACVSVSSMCYRLVRIVSTPILL